MLPWRLSWSTCRHENVTQVAEKGAKVKKKRRTNEKVVCEDLPQPAEIIPLATPLADLAKLFGWLLTRRPALTTPFVVSRFQSFQRLEESAFARSEPQWFKYTAFWPGRA